MVAGLLLAAATADARELFKWIAQDGSVHYGEVLPDTGVAYSETLEVVPAETSPAAPDYDYRAILEIADRLQADRLARERVRLEQRKLRLEERRMRQRGPDHATEPRYFPVYRPWYGSHPRYPWHRRDSRPDRPGPAPRQAGTPSRRVYPFGSVP
jgi:hypothetical protein